MARYDYVIIGQGIAGTVLAYSLLKRGRKVLVIDAHLSGRSSEVAAGIINPVTGRNYVKSWLIDELLPAAKLCYEGLEELLGGEYLIKKPVYRALHSPKDENAWMARTGDPFYKGYISECISKPEQFEYIKSAFSYGVVHHGHQLRIKELIYDFREYLIKRELIIEKTLDFKKDGSLNQIIAPKEYARLIFCEGHRVVDNPLWNYLPFDPVKGEMLYVKIPKIRLKDNYRHKMFLTHLYDDIYWVGASYIKQYPHKDVTQPERDKMTAFLEEILDTDFEIIDHKAGIRPAVKTRKPLLGRHPNKENYYIFNGLGAKGSSLAPYFAEHLLAYIEKGNPLLSEVDISKYSK